MSLLAASLIFHATEVMYRPWSPSQGFGLTPDAWVADALESDILFIGEHHGAAPIHAMQLRVMQIAADSGIHVVLAMEQFDRDVQGYVNDFVRGTMTQATFEERARPWPNFQESYLPLLSFARDREIPVVAANAPLSVVRQVGRQGIEALNEAEPALRELLPASLNLEDDIYNDYFRGEIMQVMEAHGMSDTSALEARLDAMTVASRLRDETMALAIVDYLEANEWLNDRGRWIVIVTCGAFHSNYRHGIPDILQAMTPERELAMAVISPLAVGWNDEVDFESMMEDPPGDWIYSYPAELAPQGPSE